MLHVRGAVAQPIPIENLIADHGGEQVLGAMLASRQEHALPPGQFGRIAQALINCGEVEGDKKPTHRQRALLPVPETVEIDNQETALSFIGAILDKYIEDVKSTAAEPIEGNEKETYQEPLSVYALGAYVLRYAISTQRHGGDGGLQHLSLLKFNELAEEFDFGAHVEGLMPAKRGVKKESIAARERKQRADEAEIRGAERRLERITSNEFGQEVLAICQGAEIKETFPGRLIDLAEGLIRMGAVNHIGKPLAKLLDKLEANVDDPAEALRFAAALSDTYLASMESYASSTMRSSALGQVRLLLLLTIGLPLRKSARYLHIAHGETLYNRMIKKAGEDAFKKEAYNRKQYPIYFPEVLLTKSYQERMLLAKDMAPTEKAEEVSLRDVAHLLAQVAMADGADAARIQLEIPERLRHADKEEVANLAKDLKSLYDLITLHQTPYPATEFAPSGQETRDKLLLSAEEEVELAFSIEAGLFASEKLDIAAKRGVKLNPQLERDLRQLVRDGRRDKERFIRANHGLVVSLALKRRSSGLELDDLVQEGKLGLIRAVEMFDYKKGNKFSTYAHAWIKQAIDRAVYDQARTIRLPQHVGEQLKALKNASSRLENELKREPTMLEIAKEMDITVDKLVMLKQFALHTTSLNRPINDDGRELLDIVADTATHEATSEELTIDSKAKEALRAASHRLTRNEAIVINRRLLASSPMSYEDLAELLDRKSREIRAIEERAIIRLTKRVPELKEFLLSGGSDE